MEFENTIFEPFNGYKPCNSSLDCAIDPGDMTFCMFQVEEQLVCSCDMLFTGSNCKTLSGPGQLYAILFLVNLCLSIVVFQHGVFRFARYIFTKQVFHPMKNLVRIMLAAELIMVVHFAYNVLWLTIFPSMDGLVFYLKVMLPMCYAAMPLSVMALVITWGNFLHYTIKLKRLEKTTIERSIIVYVISMVPLYVLFVFYAVNIQYKNAATVAIVLCMTPALFMMYYNKKIGSDISNFEGLKSTTNLVICRLTVVSILILVGLQLYINFFARVDISNLAPHFVAVFGLWLTHTSLMLMPIIVHRYVVETKVCSGKPTIDNAQSKELPNSFEGKIEAV